MEAVRSLVEYLADFGDLLSAQIICNGVEVYLITGTEEVLIFSLREKRVKTVLQFDSRVTFLSLSDDQAHLYSLCENEGLYCITLSPETSSAPISAEEWDEPVLSRVSRDSVVIEDGNICSFVVAEGLVVTASLHESIYHFDLYKAAGCLAKCTGFQKHAGFQVLAVAQNAVDASTADRLSLVLSCIYPNSPPKRHTSKHCFRLSPLLFRLLFGVDASLVHSPVILCGLPDGRLLFFPLLLPALTDSKGEQRSQIRTIYSLEQPIAFIGTSVIREQGPECLVVIGQNGKVLLIRANQASSDGKAVDCSFIEHNMQGPVVCACVDSERLYYCTSSNLFSLPLSKTLTSSHVTAETREESSTIDRPAFPPQVSICLNVCRVITLAEVSINPTGPVQLLAVSLSGKLLLVSVPEESEKACLPKLTSSQAGQKVKDLLAGIGNVWERAAKLKEQLQLKNNILKHLNQVINICHLLSNYQQSDQDTCNDRPPISCRAVAKWHTLLQKDSLVITLIMENLSDCVLDQGWTLCIQVQSVHSPTAGQASRSYSFPLKKLDCGQKVEVDLPLEMDEDLFLPVHILCTLVYSLQRLFNTMDSRLLSQQLRNGTNSISLALNTLTLDWLDALRITKHTSHSGAISKAMSTWEATRTFLNSRLNHTEEQPVTKAAPYTVAIHISSELLRHSLNLHGLSTAVLCTSVLKWLVCGTAKAEESNPVQSSVVCAHGPDGNTVRLLAKEVMLSDFSAEGPLSVVEVQVESVSMAAVCGLHHAVLRRAKVILKNAAATYESPPKLKGQRLRETIQHLESLHKDIQSFHDPAASVGMTTSRRNSESLFHLYLRLREKPLVIL